MHEADGTSIGELVVGSMYALVTELEQTKIEGKTPPELVDNLSNIVLHALQIYLVGYRTGIDWERDNRQ